MRGRRLRPVLAALALALVLVAGWASPAGAHATLVSTSPADGSTVKAEPKQVELDYSEAVTVNLGGVRVFDSQGTRVDQGNSARGATSSQVTVGLKPSLPDGTYIVNWRVVSADSHPVHGGFLFSIGKASAVAPGVTGSLIDDQGDRGWQVLAAALRGLAYAGALLAAGGAVFLTVIGDEEDRAPSRSVLDGAAALGAIAVVAGLPVQATLATGLGIGSITEPGVFRQVLGEGFGLSILGTLVGLAAIVITARVATSPTTRWCALGGAALAAGSFAFAGHTRLSDPVWASNLADAVHASAAAVWFGGTVMLALALKRRWADADASGPASMLARYSSLAGWALLGVSVAGGVLAWAEVRALRALTSTTYGWLVVAKVAAVAVIAAIGGYNRFRLVPAVQQAPTAAAGWRSLRRTVAIEAIGMVGVLGLTGVLVNVTPARTAAGVGTVTSITEPLGDGTVNLTIDPARAGQNSIHIYLLDSVGRQVDRARSLELELTLPAKGIGPLDAKAFKAGAGHWQVDGDDLSVAGRWQIVVVARTGEFDEERATADVAVTP